MRFLIYCRENILNNKKYIGITTKTLSERAGKNGKRYLKKNKDGEFVHKKLAQAIAKYGWKNFKSYILEEFEGNLSDALEKEVNYISKFDSFNSGYNSSMNILSDNDIINEYTKSRKIKVNQLDKNGNLIKIFNSATDAGKSLNLKWGSRGITACCRGKFRAVGGFRWEYNDPELQKIFKPKELKYIDWEDEKIYKCNKYNGKIIEEYRNVFDLKDEFNIDRIKQSILSKNIKSYKGYIWKSESRKNIEKKNNNFREIAQIDLEKDIVLNIFSSIKEAADCLKIKENHIIDAANGRAISANGFRWSYTDKIFFRRNTKRNKPLIAINKNDETKVFYFNNTSEAVEFIKNQGIKISGIEKINTVCRGERKSAYGYIWKKIEL